ncbi:hypothetical protein WJX74_007511 [Apatococcus lobatus]|uniref:Protein kinase domain-containing protein n=1 Tax=Apatococcus lobatus TaxID=904363 RepID=A0AAW1RK20_9CHLO
MSSEVHKPLPTAQTLENKENPGADGPPSRKLGNLPPVQRFARGVLSRRENTPDIKPSLLPHKTHPYPSASKPSPAANPTGAPKAPSQGGMLDRPAWDTALHACMGDMQQRGKMTAKLQASAADIRKDVRSPEAWQAFLQQAQSAGQDSSGHLRRLAQHAVGLVPCKGNYHNQAYLDLRISHACQQWAANEDEGRQQFKDLKDQSIGLGYAPLWMSWATLEARHGDSQEAASKLRKGIKLGAQPVGDLEEMLRELQRLRPGRSCLTVCPEPAVGATPIVITSRPGASLETPRDHLNLEGLPKGYPGSQQPGAAPSTARSVLTSASLSGSSSCEDPSGTLHSRFITPLTNFTHHSRSDRSSSSEEATANFHSTRALTGLLGASSHLVSSQPTVSSATETGKEVAQAAVHGTTPDEKSQEGPQPVQRETPAGQSSSFQENRPMPASLRRSDLKAPGAARLLSGGLSGAFHGPKRLGLGGGAARIRIPSPAPAMATLSLEDVDDDQGGDGPRKRKAEAEARKSPKAVLEVPNTTKRRQSPQAEQSGRPNESKPPLAPASAPGSLRQPDLPIATDARCPQSFVRYATSIEAAERNGSGHPRKPPSAADLHVQNGSRQSEPAPDKGLAEDEAEDTIPIVHSKLAMRAMAGRQSLLPAQSQAAPPKQRHATKSAPVQLPRQLPPSRPAALEGSQPKDTLPSTPQAKGKLGESRISPDVDAHASCMTPDSAHATTTVPSRMHKDAAAPVGEAPNAHQAGEGHSLSGNLPSAVTSRADTRSAIAGQGAHTSNHVSQNLHQSQLSAPERSADRQRLEHSKQQGPNPAELQQQPAAAMEGVAMQHQQQQPPAVLPGPGVHRHLMQAAGTDDCPMQQQQTVTAQHQQRNRSAAVGTHPVQQPTKPVQQQQQQEGRRVGANAGPVEQSDGHSPLNQSVSGHMMQPVVRDDGNQARARLNPPSIARPQQQQQASGAKQVLQAADEENGGQNAERPGPQGRADLAHPHPQPLQMLPPQPRRVREDENTVLVGNNRYTKLECIGKGGSSKVFKVMAPNRKIFALKRIRLQGRDREAASGFIDEITLLQRLRGQRNIIQLLDSEVLRQEGIIYMVLECGDIDLARLLARHEKGRREGAAGEIDENFIRLYWQQMLQAVDTIHEARIVHSDLKPANFLMVEGVLKLIDFGIAKAISSDTTSIARESQVGTLNYMSPEAILGGQNNIRGCGPMKVGRPSDIWSLGCILFQMAYGHTPFAAFPFIQKMHAITDPGHTIEMPPLPNAALVDVLRRCLDRSARTRITMQELLQHPFLRPGTRPAPANAPTDSIGISRDQLKKLLTQASQAGAGANLDRLSEELFRQLEAGEALCIPTPQAAGRARPQHHSKLPEGHSGAAGEILKVPLAAAAAAAVATRASIEANQDESALDSSDSQDLMQVTHFR